AGRCVDLIHHADVGMADFERALQFRRQQAAKAGLGALNGHPQTALGVKRFVNHAHAAIAYAAQDFETPGHGLAGFEDLLHGFYIDEFKQRTVEEAGHALFPGDYVRDFAVEFGIVVALRLQKALALAERGLQGLGGQGHHALISFCGVDRHTLLSRANSHLRPSCKWRSVLRRERSKVLAISLTSYPM